MYEIIDDWMVFDDVFNEPLSNVVFPMGIQKIKFGFYFNQNISNLPNSITYLRFCWSFNQNVGKLPNSLTHLYFSCYFNQDISNLPNSITHLIFGWSFNKDISQLPKSITYLKFNGWSSEFNHNLNPYLYHLTNLDIKNNHKHKSIMLARCRINQHNSGIREDKLIDLLLKN